MNSENGPGGMWERHSRPVPYEASLEAQGQLGAEHHRVGRGCLSQLVSQFCGHFSSQGNQVQSQTLMHAIVVATREIYC